MCNEISINQFVNEESGCCKLDKYTSQQKKRYKDLIFFYLYVKTKTMYM